MTLRTHRVWIALVLGILVVGVAGAASEQESFDQLLGDYEAIRLALASDSMEGVAAHSQSLGHHAEAHLKHLTAHGGHSSGEDSMKMTEALEAISGAAATLETAEDLSAARPALFELTKPMVQVRNLVGDESTLVAFCPMAKKSWLQPTGDLGNPYLGQEMPSCGEVVSD